MSNTVHKIKHDEHSAGREAPQSRGRRIAAFLAQLRERKVCRAAVAYMIATWLVLQLGEILFPALSLPDWTLTLVLVLAILEFPVAMLLSWLFNWTPDGLVVDAPLGAPAASRGKFDMCLNFALLLAAALLSLQLASYRAVAGAGQPTADGDQDTIAVLSVLRADAVGASAVYGLEQEIRHQLLQSRANHRVAAAGDRMNGIVPAPATLAIESTLYEHGENLQLLVQLIDLRDGSYVDSVLLEAEPVGAVGAREQLARRAVDVVLGNIEVALVPGLENEMPVDTPTAMEWHQVKTTF